MGHAFAVEPEGVRRADGLDGEDAEPGDDRLLRGAEHEAVEQEDVDEGRQERCEDHEEGDERQADAAEAPGGPDSITERRCFQIACIVPYDHR